MILNLRARKLKQPVLILCPSYLIYSTQNAHISRVYLRACASVFTQPWKSYFQVFRNSLAHCGVNLCPSLIMQLVLPLSNSLLSTLPRYCLYKFYTEYDVQKKALNKRNVTFRQCSLLLSLSIFTCDIPMFVQEPYLRELFSLLRQREREKERARKRQREKEKDRQ